MSHPPYSLRELEAVFMKRLDDTHRLRVDDIAEADGIMFMCPACYQTNNGPIGTHQVLCWFNGRVPDTEQPGPGRWQPSDTSTNIDNLTFVPHTYIDANGTQQSRTQSVLLTSGCQWHGYVTDGRAHT